MNIGDLSPDSISKFINDGGDIDEKVVLHFILMEFIFF